MTLTTSVNVIPASLSRTSICVQAFRAWISKTSVTITRESAYYASAVPVDLDVNGARIASIPNGGSYSGPLPEGPVTMSATSWSSPGRFTIRFNAQAGKRYAFELSPRGEQVFATVAFGMVGLAADTIAHDETSGAFKITEVGK